MEITLRNETEKDYRRVEEITREAFWNLYRPGCDEHFTLHRARLHPDFIPELDFVALADGELAGNIVYTRSWLTDEQGGELEIVTFGPVCVLPRLQHQGIGARLIRHTLQLAAGQGIKAVVILGDPHNYCRHGFKNAKDLGISDLEGNHPYGMLALELEQGALSGHAWKYRYSTAYEIDEQEAEAFDQGFEEKEKHWQPSQEVFGMQVRAVVR